MAEMTYVFGDVLTGSIIEEIRLTGVSMKMNLDTGEFRGTFHLDQSGKDNDTLVTATTPGRCWVIPLREGQPVGDYLVWTRTYQSQAKSAQLYGIPWKEYPSTRLITSNFTATNVEQRNLFVSLYQLMQQDPNSARIDLPDVFPNSVNKSVEVLADEKKYYRQVLDSIADASDGFDWLVRTSFDGNKPVRWLDIGYPSIGALNSAALPVFEYIQTDGGAGGNITNYWINDSMGSGATNFYGIGSGEGSTMLQSTYIHQDLLRGGFPRYDATVDRKDISNQGLLNALTAQYAQIYKAPAGVITAEVKGDADPPFGGYNLGDACRISINDPRFPHGFTRLTRVLGWEYYPQEDTNVEYARLTFEGED